jgi:hypothetical protein
MLFTTRYRRRSSARLPIGWRISRILHPFVPVLALAALWASLSISVALAASPSGVSVTLEGCRNNGTITLPNSSGQFICPDSAYTSGNLGKGWNELDLVPYRLTADAGNSAPSSQTYTIAIVVDNKDAGASGYDVLSVPVLNTAKSHASCTAPTVTSETLLIPGLGGISESRYRLVTITQAKNTTCVYDYYARLALGSHLFPGSSLHANLANEKLGTAGIGARDVSIPVREILPQEISKDMTATQDSDHVWDITKQPTPASISFGNTCDPAAPRSAGVEITVTWTRLPATPSGPITVITHIYAKNPASRLITVNVTDQIRSGTTVLDTISSGPVDVPANTASFLLLTHQTTVPAGTTNLNDIATATYTDQITSVPVPGNTTATASATVQSSGSTTNQTAIINDVETISGSGLTFSADSFSGASGSFGSYVAGTPTTGPVSWTSDSQSGNGSVTFKKTIYVASATVTSGQLSDIATVNGSNGFSKSTSAAVTIDSDARVRLIINKSINPALSTGTQTFTFRVKNSAGVEVEAPTITFSAGETNKSVTVSNLAPGAYTVTEDPVAGWVTESSKSTTITLPACEGSVTFANTQKGKIIVEKQTIPDGDTATFNFAGEIIATLGDGGTSEKEVAPGTYSVSEAVPAGWNLTDITCSDSNSIEDEGAATATFNVEAGETVKCTFTNTKQATVIVKKVMVGGTDSFIYIGIPNGTISINNGTIQASVIPGQYESTEAMVDGWDLTDISCNDTDSVGDETTRTATFNVTAGETVICTFTNTKRGEIIVEKQTIPDGDTATFNFTGEIEATLGDGGTSNKKVVPGTYNVVETVPTGWELTDITCSDPNSSGDLATATATFNVEAGETVKCTFTNDAIEPKLTLVKVVVNDDGGTATADRWILKADGDGGFFGNGVQDAGENKATLGPNEVKPNEPYELLESGPAGYTPSAWECTSALGVQSQQNLASLQDRLYLPLISTVGGLQAAEQKSENKVAFDQVGNIVTLAYGDDVICTIVNDDQPGTLIVKKVVINDNGGTKIATDFKFSVDDGVNTGISFIQDTDLLHGKNSLTVDAGTYNVTEDNTPIAGYTTSYDNCSDVVVTNGGTQTCTITNDDIQPKLTLIKTVKNDNGGTKEVSDFPLFVNSTQVTSGQANSFNAGNYTASETQQYGYTASAWGGDCAANGSVTLNVGDDKTCTITNDDQPGTIIVRKITKPTTASTSFSFDAGGTGYNDFSLANGQQDSQSLNAGSYTVKELVPLGWVLTGIGGSTNPDTPYNCTVTGSGGSTGVGDLNTQTATINLKNGDTVTCVFENTGQGVTRTQGFWSTHPELAQIAWFGGTAFGHTFPGVANVSSISDRLICGREVNDLNKLMGAFWSDISKTSTGAKRSALDQARMQLLQQLIAAELNASAFGSAPTSGSFASWEAALCGTNQNAIKTAQQQAASFNSAGDSGTFTPGTSANSKYARSIADRPFWDVIKL